jgi:predicted nucleic acid-binding protein
MSSLVIDASVAVKWYTQEENRDEAIKILQAHMGGEIELTSPTLLAYEVINALRYNPSLTPEDQEKAVAALFLIGIDLKPPTQELMKKATRLANKYDITIYDAVYLSQAILQDTNLVTADKELTEKAQETGKITELIPLTSK